MVTIKSKNLATAACCAMIVDKTLERVVIELEFNKKPEAYNFVRCSNAGAVEMYRYLALHGILVGAWTLWEQGIGNIEPDGMLNVNIQINRHDALITYGEPMSLAVWDHEARIARSPRDGDLQLEDLRIFEWLPLTRLQ